MDHRTLGQDLTVSALGLGCMGMSEFYGPRDDQESLAVLAPDDPLIAAALEDSAGFVAKPAKWW